MKRFFSSINADHLLVLLLLFSCVSCANYQAHFSRNINYELPQDSIVYSSFFVGDIGQNPKYGARTLKTIQHEMAQSFNKQSLLLLGDITGKGGFIKGIPSHVEHIDTFINILEHIEGKVFITPGENELGNNGYFSRLKELEDYFQDHSKKKVRFMPKKACSGPNDKEIYEGIGLIGLNTAWYLAPWNKEAEISEGCDFNDRHDFLFAAADEIKSYRDKVKIVMMHHPLQSNGNRGGNYSPLQHLFPLTDLIPNAYLPLPVVGSVVRILQGVGGGSQDLTSLRYKDLIRQLRAKTEDEENIIFIGAHEHSMLYADYGHHHIITAGSGSTKGPSVGGKKASFSYGEIGFGRLDFTKSGAVFLRFFTVSPEGKAHEVFSKKIINNRFKSATPDLPAVIQDSIRTDIVTTSVYGKQSIKRSGIYNALFGKHYRDIYTIEVAVPALNLDSIHQGLTPYKRGGGQSTQSLHTRGGDGHLYKLRSVRKNPAQMLPDILERSFAADLAKDQFTALHPFAHLTLPRMQEALGLLAAKPQLYYVPKQSSLKKYNSIFGGELYYLEQRADEDWSNTGFYANSKNIISNNRVREEMAKSWKHRADQKNYLLARLFDFWVGDWDRHRDQWRWAEIEQENGLKKYLPIARDRDQTYSNFDGALLKLTGIFIPDTRKLSAFGYEMGNARWRSLNGKWNDRFFLNELTLEDYESAAKTLMQRMTDQLIDDAMSDFPIEVQAYSLEQEDIGGKLKKRRSQLLNFARDYYKHLAKVVTLTASDQDDFFEILSTDNQQLVVRIYDADQDGQADEQYYERTFSYPETKEIRLYGLDGNDIFKINGPEKHQIKIRIIGGTDKDTLIASGKLKAIVYDDEKGIDIQQEQHSIRDRSSNRYPELNQYQFQAYKEDYSIPAPIVGFNVDDGFFFGFNFNSRKHGFRPNPYAINHTLGASYSSNKTIKVDYKGIFNNTFGRRHDLMLKMNYRSPNFIVNFFGMGNDTAAPDTRSLSFNRSRQEHIFVNASLRLRSEDNKSGLIAGPFIHTVKVNKEDPNGEPTLIGQVGMVNERVFNRQAFAGIKIDYQFNNLAYPAIPDNGIKLKLGAEQTFNLGASRHSFLKYGGALTYYQFFGRQILGVASRIGYEHIHGDFEFYQAAQLGGRTNFRAARSERFLGYASFHHNTDIRIRAIGFGRKATLATAGLLLGFDHGRVWSKQHSSQTWHYAYGGGLWIAPANIFVISATYFSSKSENRVNIGAGFPF